LHAPVDATLSVGCVVGGCCGSAVKICRGCRHGTAESPGRRMSRGLRLSTLKPWGISPHARGVMRGCTGVDADESDLPTLLQPRGSYRSSLLFFHGLAQLARKKCGHVIANQAFEVFASVFVSWFAVRTGVVRRLSFALMLCCLSYRRPSRPIETAGQVAILCSIGRAHPGQAAAEQCADKEPGGSTAANPCARPPSIVPRCKSAEQGSKTTIAPAPRWDRCVAIRVPARTRTCVSLRA